MLLACRNTNKPDIISKIARKLIVLISKKKKFTDGKDSHLIFCDLSLNIVIHTMFFPHLFFFQTVLMRVRQQLWESNLPSPAD